MFFESALVTLGDKRGEFLSESLVMEVLVEVDAAKLLLL